MTASKPSLPPVWRSLKDMYEHYLALADYEEGRSAVELIDSYSQQRRFVRSSSSIASALWPTKPRNELLLLEQLKTFDEKIEKTRSDVQQKLIDDATNGALVVMGRRRPESDHERIPSRPWAFLRLDLEQGAAKGDGLSYYDLRCALTNELPEPAQKTKKRLSRTDLVAPEFTRRCKTGELEDSLAQEAQYLVAWFRTNYPVRNAIASKTVKNTFRKQYKAVKKSKSEKGPKTKIRASI